MVPFVLVWRNLLRHPLRSVLTVLCVAIAVFLICFLRTMVTTLHAGVDAADNRRLAVMSRNGLFAALPLKYQAAIENIEGVELTTKFQWFGGYYRSQKNFFAQFAVDPETMFAMYPECKVPAEEQEAFRRSRTSCVIGSELVKEFGWKIGDTVPIIGSLNPHPEDKAWEFQVAGVYHSDVPNFDNRTLFLHWEYFEETLKAGGNPPGVGVFSIKIERDADAARVIADVEAAFEDSEQRVDCSTEAEFQRQFVTMFGNVPKFLGWIGSGVVVVILLASINTMLMALRDQAAEIGVLKSLGFTDMSMFMLLVAQSVLLCLLGGAVGLGIAAGAEAPISEFMVKMFPGFAIHDDTFLLAGAAALLIGLIAGAAPAWRARNMPCVEAFRGTD
jgi:putative ABC transport system permease protein